MTYQLTSIESHIDFGFGVTGESYYYSAEHLYENQKSIKVFQQVEMPANYLFRHSIELFLKSLIIIFHHRLKIPFDKEPFDTDKPKIFTAGNWKDLYTCHWIDELYNYWLNELLLKHKEQLEKLAPQGDWQEEQSISKLFPLITSYDKDSSFFRYPVTKNSSLDPQKYSMQRIDLETIFGSKSETNNKRPDSKIFTLMKNDNDEIVEGFALQKNVLDIVTQALKKVSHYFCCIHIMTRVTLCKGS